MKAFVAGSTGYVGKAVVKELGARDVETHAHVRPGSSSLDTARAEFGALGATVDTTPWDEEAMKARMAELRPDLVFACLGTTRARMKSASDPDKETYDAVDYGLTALLIRACVEAEVKPRFVYLSAAGTGPKSPSAYMQARWKAENYLMHSELPYTIARPSFITGKNRDENRPGEYYGAKAADAALAVASAVGFVGLRNRYRSTDDETLATALVEWALDDAGANRILEGKDLRRHRA